MSPNFKQVTKKNSHMDTYLYLFHLFYQSFSTEHGLSIVSINCFIATEVGILCPEY